VPGLSYLLIWQKVKHFVQPTSDTKQNFSAMINRTTSNIIPAKMRQQFRGS
jgi:hypothetical protein